MIVNIVDHSVSINAQINCAPQVVNASVFDTVTHIDAVISGEGARGANPGVSAKPLNRLELEPDGLYVSNDLVSDPLAYYILAKN